MQLHAEGYAVHHIFGPSGEARPREVTREMGVWALVLAVCAVELGRKRTEQSREGRVRV